MAPKKSEAAQGSVIGSACHTGAERSVLFVSRFGTRQRVFVGVFFQAHEKARASVCQEKKKKN